MLNKEETGRILNKFMDECYAFWRRNGRDHKEAFELALKDIECLKHDPYVPCGEEIDLDAKAEFIKMEITK